MNKVYDVKTLPRWAQNYIESLELEIKKAQRQHLTPAQAKEVVAAAVLSDKYFDYNTDLDEGIKKLIAMRDEVLGLP